MIRRRAAVPAARLVAGSLFAAGPAIAAWPDRPITLIVRYPQTRR